MKYRNLIASIAIALGSLTLAGCQSSNVAGTADATTKSLAPQRVDIRGSITRSRYDQGQVMLEVEAFGNSPDSRYNQAYVLVLPTAQLIGPDGQTLSISELRQGQNVAIVLRGGGQGTFTGLGVARKVWVEDRF